MKNDLIITGWGWKEYAVAAAAALRALKGSPVSSLGERPALSLGVLLVQ